jgi:hypothetical protein
MKPQKLLSYPKCVVMAEVTPLRVRINGADASEQQSLIMPGVAAQPVPCGDLFGGAAGQSLSKFVCGDAAKGVGLLGGSSG